MFENFSSKKKKNHITRTKNKISNNNNNNKIIYNFAKSEKRIKEPNPEIVFEIKMMKYSRQKEREKERKKSDDIDVYSGSSIYLCLKKYSIDGKKIQKLS